MKVSADVCPLCQGTGWKPVSSQRVARCDCRLRVRNQTLLSAARIPKRYEHCELSNFEFDEAHSGLASARMSACRFVEEYPLDTTGLLLAIKYPWQPRSLISRKFSQTGTASASHFEAAAPAC